ncbi:MAG: hypothetical protein ACYC4H_08285 [Desulfocucumaceae bacterium]
MKSLVVKIHSWMERNLEDPFFKAEMARATPSKERDGATTAIHISIAAALVMMVCWLLVTVV